MPPLPAKLKRGITQEIVKSTKNIVYKFQIFCFPGTQVTSIESAKLIFFRKSGKWAKNVKSSQNQIWPAFYGP